MSKSRMNEAKKLGMTSYSIILVFLLRMRQACDAIQIINKEDEDIEQSGTSNYLSRMTRGPEVRVSEDGNTLFIHLHHRLRP